MKLAENEIPTNIYKKYGRTPKAVDKPSTEFWKTKSASSWNVKGLKFALNLLQENKTKGALLVLGDAGIGKSEVVKSFAKSVADEDTDRQFIEIHNVQHKERADLFEHPEKYYVLLDLRASQLQPEQASGIPDVDFGKEKGYLQFMAPDWAYLISKPEFHGFVFLDEINRANPSVINTLFQFVLDRQISGRKVSDEVMIAAAANLGDGFQGTTPVDSAFMSRFDVGVLVAEPELWAEWARGNGVSQYIVDFALSNPGENFFGSSEDVEEGNIPLNPRQLEYASVRLQQVENVYANVSENGGELPDMFSGNIYDDIAHAIKSRVPNEWVNNFVQWLEIVHAFDWAEIVDKAKSGAFTSKGGGRGKEELTGSKKWALTRYITNEVMARFDKARHEGDKTVVKSLLEELYNDLFTILSGIDADNTSFIMKALVNGIKYNPPPGITPQQGAENWNLLMVPIAKKAQADNPTFFKKLKQIMEDLGKIKT